MPEVKDDLALPVTVSAAALGGAIAAFSGPTEGHDNAIVTASIGFNGPPEFRPLLVIKGS